MKITALPIILLTVLLPFTMIGQSEQQGKRPTVGLVLSGGGAKGFAYIGLLKALQEAELQVDYVGGTSIGSIMGGLYAIGYSPESIEEMIREQNWDNLLTDQISRKYVAYPEKEFGEKAVVTLPFKSKKITLGAALYKGQEIDLLLNHYFSPAYKTRDFRDLHTPFLCMCTNLITGEQVQLDSGNLARAVRSSMSIPGYFKPVEYQGKYLVDGGVVNNFPVKNVKEAGAQIIVAGDVQPGLRQSPEDLNSITNILDQIVTFAREDANKEAYTMVDLYVKLDNPYSIMAFEEYDSLIVFGKRVAEQNFDKIKRLADSLNAIEYKPLKPYDTKPLDSVDVKNIYFYGFDKIPLQYFTGYWKNMSGERVALSDIEESVRLMYGTRFFEHVYYEFEANGDEINLLVHVKEAGIGEVSAAVHFDNNYLGSLLINLTLRNTLGKRSKLFADMVLGPNPRFRAMYLIDNGRRIGVGGMLDFYSFKFDLFDQTTKINKIDFTNFKASVFAHSILSNIYQFRAGFDYEYFQFKQDVLVDTIIDKYKNFTSYGTLFASFYADTRDNPRFPTRGFQSDLRIEYVMPLGNNFVSNIFDNSFVALFNYQHNIPIKARWVFRPGLFAGATFPSNTVVPFQHAFAFGGLNPSNYIDSFVPFTGVKFFQKTGQYALMGKAHLQFNFAKKLYATALLDVGTNTDYFEDMFLSRSWIAGYGITLGYDSFIGPVELTVMGSNINKGPLLFLNLGYWF